MSQPSWSQKGPWIFRLCFAFWPSSGAFYWKFSRLLQNLESTVGNHAFGFAFTRCQYKWPALATNDAYDNALKVLHETLQAAQLWHFCFPHKVQTWKPPTGCCVKQHFVAGRDFMLQIRKWLTSSLLPITGWARLYDDFFEASSGSMVCYRGQLPRGWVVWMLKDLSRWEEKGNHQKLKYSRDKYDSAATNWKGYLVLVFRALHKISHKVTLSNWVTLPQRWK